MIKLISNRKEVSFKITKFPDGTSQVWNIDELAFQPGDYNYISWVFENEAELFHVCQLAALHKKLYDDSIKLFCPYLPYGRQDKAINNNLSFALSVAKNLLFESGINSICTYDAHSQTDFVKSWSPTVFHQSVLNHDMVCFPDKGALARYKTSLCSTRDLMFIYAEKVRNQDTGDITGLDLITNGIFLKDKKILIIDDICDGGMTFIKLAQKLKEHNPAQIDLAVSHGIFSKGKQVLYDAGIANIYTTNSLPNNPDGFDVIRRSNED